MKKINLKEHTKKYVAISKKAASGTYPNKKVAKVGSRVGLGMGVALLGLGIYGLTKSPLIGLGSTVAGVTTLISNSLNLKRLKE